MGDAIPSSFSSHGPPAVHRGRVVIRSDPSALVADWGFTPSSTPPRIRLRRLAALLFGAQAAPAWRVVRPVTPAARWNVLFLFVPAGMLDDDQLRMLDRLRRSAAKLLVIYAAPREHEPLAALDGADALAWKDLPGFDFSAYAIALRLLAEGSPGADVYVQNDSVLGPFAPIDPLVSAAPWDLTGFIGSAAGENHISSFAFILRDVTPERVDALAPAITDRRSFNRFDHVVTAQELRLARIAARSMSVGARLFLPLCPAQRPLLAALRSRLMETPPPPLDLTADATLGFPLQLLDRGFPFMKRSLFGKSAGVADERLLRERLVELDWRDAP